MSLNQQVREFWEQAPCGTDMAVVGELPRHSREWFEQVENNRYELEPFIHSFAQFTRHRGKKILEVGVGAGTDHLQWARAGAICFGVDLTQAAIDTTSQRLALYGLRSQLQRVDAEILPFEDNTFELVYSWGVIHHSEQPEKIVNEIYRVLKPGGTLLCMMYKRYSLTTLRTWLKHALLAGRPLRTFSDVLWHHMESAGTKAYTVKELKAMFSQFDKFSAKSVLTPYDIRRLPGWIAEWVPERCGWFITIKARK